MLQFNPVGPAAIGAPIRSVAAQGDKEKPGPYGKADFEALEFRNLHEVPGLAVLTRLESEAALKERMRQETLKTGKRIIFPEEAVIAKEPYPGRDWAPKAMQIEPTFVCHDRLLFEQQNFERGLWDLGILTPVVCAGKFYVDVVALPYHLGTRPRQCYDCSAGKCLPGDPTPLFLYPPELSLTGLATEAGVLTGMFFVFP
jgi:hypothetical protein